MFTLNETSLLNMIVLLLTFNIFYAVFWSFQVCDILFHIRFHHLLLMSLLHVFVLSFVKYLYEQYILHLPGNIVVKVGCAFSG